MYIINILILLHVLGDSIFLTKKLKQQKIEKVSYLFLHVGIYTLLFLLLTPLLLGLSLVQDLEFSMLVGMLHFVIDFIITRIKRKYWRTHKYLYVLIASLFEHLIQVSVLITLYLYLFPTTIDFDNWYNIVRYFFFEKPV